MEACPSSVNKHRYNSCTFWLVRFSCSLKIWMKETFCLPSRTCSSLSRKRCGASGVISFMQKMLAFKNNPLAYTSLFLYQRIKNLFSENKIMVILLWQKKSLFIERCVFKEHSVTTENTWPGILRGKWVVQLSVKCMYAYVWEPECILEWKGKSFSRSLDGRWCNSCIVYFITCFIGKGHWEFLSQWFVWIHDTNYVIF